MRHWPLSLLALKMFAHQLLCLQLATVHTCVYFCFLQTLLLGPEIHVCLRHFPPSSPRLLARAIVVFVFCLHACVMFVIVMQL